MDDSAGALVRRWRLRRRFSQLELSGRTGVSTRHLSCVETGKAQPSRALLRLLAEGLAIPLRTRNTLLLAAGYAPEYGEHRLADEPMRAVRDTLDTLLAGHEPFPAVVMDESFRLVAANSGCAIFLDGVADGLLRPPVNVMRLWLHPDGVAPRIANLDQVLPVALARVRRAAEAIASDELAELYDELAAYPGADVADPGRPTAFLPIRLRLPASSGGGELTLLNTIATFGGPLDPMLEGLAIETFFPADPDSRQYLSSGAGQ